MGKRLKRGSLALMPRVEALAASGDVRLVVDGGHFETVIEEGLLGAKVSIDIATADFKAMLIPREGRREARSVVAELRRLAGRGVEIRVLHAGVPSAAALLELAGGLPENVTIRRCPRLHAKAVIVDSCSMYLGSANLTGAGLGAKGDTRRNFEWGVWTRSAALIESVLDQYNALWEGRRCEGCGRKDVCPVPLEEPDL